MSKIDRDTVTDKVRLVLHRVENDVLPLPDSIHFFDEAVEFNWMQQDSVENSRKVLNAYPGDWTQHPGSDARDLILVWQERGMKINLWCHRDAVRMSFEVTR